MSEASRVLVLRLSAFGDVIHTIPAVAALRDGLGPDVRIGWAVEEAYAELVRLVAPVDEIFEVKARSWRARPGSRKTWAEMRMTRQRLKKFAGGEVSIDFQGLIKSSLVGVASGARLRFGFDRKAIRESPAVLFYNKRVRIDSSLHVIEWNLQLARAAGAGNAVLPRVDFGPFASNGPTELSQLVGANTVVVNPGAGHPSKMWDVSNFSEMVRQITASGKLRVVVVWGPGEEKLAQAIRDDSGATMAPRTTLRQLAFLLQKARLFVSGDTGPLHLAAALHTPVVGLFGPTNPRRNGPFGQLENCVDTYSTSRLMSSITVKEVVDKIEGLTR